MLVEVFKNIAGIACVSNELYDGPRGGKRYGCVNEARSRLTYEACSRSPTMPSSVKLLKRRPLRARSRLQTVRAERSERSSLFAAPCVSSCVFALSMLLA